MENLIAQVNIGQEFWLRTKQGIEAGPQTIGDYVSIILPNVFILAGIILLFLLIFAGLAFIFKAGKGDTEGTAKAKKAITAAIAGFIIVFASYWLLQIIEVVTGLNILTGGGP